MGRLVQGNTTYFLHFVSVTVCQCSYIYFECVTYLDVSKFHWSRRKPDTYTFVHNVHWKS